MSYVHSFNKGANRIGHDGRAALSALERHYPSGYQDPERFDRQLLEGQVVRLQLRYRRGQLH